MGLDPVVEQTEPERDYCHEGQVYLHIQTLLQPKMMDKSKSDLQPTILATCSGKKYVHLSVGLASDTGERPDKLDHCVIWRLNLSALDCDNCFS